MIRNLLLVALRNLKRDKWYSLLNILGLTIGITFSLFLMFYIEDELSYDRHHDESERIFRVESYIKEPDKDTLKWVDTPFPMGPALHRDYPEVTEAVRFVSGGNVLYKVGEASLNQDKVFFVDSNIFRVFTHPFLEGDPETALVDPNSMVLTQSVAKKFFGDAESYVGKSLENTTGDVYKITGVVADVAKNSHIIFNVLISRSSLPANFADSWGGFGFHTYVLLEPHTDAVAFEKKLLPLYDKYLASIFAQYNIKIRFGIRPITAIHLHSEMQGEPEELGSISYIYIFAAIAFFMLLIACINYMNLTTARSARRSKEIGIRKVTGSSRWQLISQFLVESTLTAFVALALSLGFIALLLPLFNSLSGKSITLDTLLRADTLLMALAVVVFVGLIGGSYPALYLSRFNPLGVLKGSLSKSSSNVALRRALVVIQFSISLIMLSCTWVVYNQLDYLRTKDLGFNKDRVMTIAANAGGDLRGKIAAFQNELRNKPGISGVSTSQAVPGSPIGFELFSVESASGFVEKGVYRYGVDEHYFQTLDMDMVAGRSFSGLPDTLGRVIVNERMVKEFGWEGQAIGRKIKAVGDDNDRYSEVVGVVKDFNQHSLYNPIAPLILFYAPNSNAIQLKLAAENMPATIATIEDAWKAFFPSLPFQYTFLDQDFDSQYAADQKRGKLFSTFSVLTILVTCLGLLGLIAFTTEQRQKEISIRKVLGARLGQLVPLIAGNFVALIGLSCLIAFPVSWYFMNSWLDLFVYNTGLSVAPFLLSVVVVLLITLATVLFHTIKAALANPVESLRDE